MLLYQISGTFQVGKSLLLNIQNENTLNQLSNDHVKYLYQRKVGKTLREVRFNLYDSVSVILTNLIVYPIDSFLKYSEKYPYVKSLPFDILTKAFRKDLSDRLVDIQNRYPVLALANEKLLETIAYTLQTEANIFANEADYNRFLDYLRANVKEYQDLAPEQYLKLSRSLDSILKHGIEKDLSYSDLIRTLTILIVESLRDFESYDKFAYARDKLIRLFLGNLIKFEVNSNFSSETLVYHYVYSQVENESIDSKIAKGGMYLDYQGMFPDYNVAKQYSLLKPSEKKNRFNVLVQKYRVITESKDRLYQKMKGFKKEANWIILNKLSKRDELLVQFNYSLSEFLNV